MEAQRRTSRFRVQKTEFSGSTSTTSSSTIPNNSFGPHPGSTLPSIFGDGALQIWAFTGFSEVLYLTKNNDFIPLLYNYLQHLQNSKEKEICTVNRNVGSGFWNLDSAHLQPKPRHKRKKLQTFLVQHQKSLTHKIMEQIEIDGKGFILSKAIKAELLELGFERTSFSLSLFLSP
jgi:hypothetical protein